MPHTSISECTCDFFDVHEYWFGFQSYDKEGNPLVRSHTLADCKYWSDLYLKAQQDGEWSTEAKVVNDGVVGGKL